MTPGLIVGVLESDGRMSFFSYGVADENTGKRLQADTSFPIGSLSKGFTAALAQRAVKRGEFTWETPLASLAGTARWSPGVRQLSPDILACHLSGMPRQPWNLQIFGDFLSFLANGRNFYQSLDQAAIETALADFEAPESPQPQYSNLGYAVLGRLLEDSSGQSLETLLEREICLPLGLETSGYGRPEGVIGHAGDQPKFIRRGQPVPPWDFPAAMKASAGMYSSARDLLVFAGAHFPGGAFAENLTVRFPRPREALARAWCVDSFGNEKLAYQVGFVSGFSAYVGVDVRHRNAVVVLQNSFNWEDRIGHRLLLRLGRREEIRNKARQ
ncbi:MAG: Beta-lactamase [Verrucomicrobiota bacterium]